MSRSDNQTMNALTREALQEALLVLLADHNLNDISITQLTKKAGVSRMSYYRNYNSLQDLFTDVLDQLFSGFLRQALPYLKSQDWLTFWTKLFDFIYENGQLVKPLLLSQSGNYVLNYMNQHFAQFAEDNYQRYTILAMIGIAYNLMGEWIKRDFDLAPEQLASICQQFLANTEKNDPITQNIALRYLPNE